jgi:cytochrome o ubiquinol oxidase subunit I
MDTYAASTGYQPFFIMAAIGVMILTAGGLAQVMQLLVSIKNRKKNRDVTGDPWNGRTLEWSVPSPAPFYNFAVIPEVHGRDAYWDMKQQGNKPVVYQDIEMPKNTAMGVYIGGLSLVLGFALVWHITWLIVVSLAACIVCVILKSMEEETEYVVTAAEIERIENARHKV